MVPHSAQRTIDRVVDVAGQQHLASRSALNRLDVLAVPVAITTASCTGPSASPTSSSFACGP